MRSVFFSYFFFLAFSFSFSDLEAKIQYGVEIEGVPDSATLKMLRSASDLYALKNRPPASMNALRYRAEGDLDEFVKILQASGFYEAKATFHIEELYSKPQVFVHIDMGPQYKIQEFSIRVISKESSSSLEQKLTLKKIGIQIDKPARNIDILHAEARALRILAECGYPLAQVKNKKIVADGHTKSVDVTIDIDAGDLCYFGPTIIEGLKDVMPLLIMQETAWKQGDLYNAALVDETTESLLHTGLFGSVLSSHPEVPSAENELPIKIDVAETKHKSVNIGASYQTFYGPGITFGWENRNLEGMGRLFTLEGDVTKRSHTGIAKYLYPNFLRMDQDYIWQLEALHESITAYSERSYNLMNRLDRKIDEHLTLSIGAKGERLFVTSSKDNGNFFLLEIPFYLRWSSANSLMNPTKGYTLEYKIVPTLNSSGKDNQYIWQQVTQSLYFSLYAEDRIVFAQKLTLGSILSRNMSAVPLPHRFLGGSDDDLRGYKYLTVSPLDDNKPIGGLSEILYTAELRLRVSKRLGFVPFFDIGKVDEEKFPHVTGKWFKSAGIGFRYFSFFGPLRFDLGFPLDRRKGIDPKYRLLVSIGQAF